MKQLKNTKSLLPNDCFNLDIVTPIRELKLEDVSYLRCPGIDGSFGVMNNHREGIFALSVGEIKVSQNGKNEYFSTGGGFAEIFNNSVKLISRIFEKSNDIDTDRAHASLNRATKEKTRYKILIQMMPELKHLYSCLEPFEGIKR